MVTALLTKKITGAATIQVCVSIGLQIFHDGYLQVGDFKKAFALLVGLLLVLAYLF